jgi:hypothetical protein
LPQNQKINLLLNEYGYRQFPMKAVYGQDGHRQGRRIGSLYIAPYGEQ